MIRTILNCLVLVHLQVLLALFVLDEPVSEGSLSAVPLALVRLLLAPGHGLHEDVLALHLGERRHERNHHLAHLGVAADAVLDADEVRAVVLHELQRREGVGGVAPEAAQLEREHVIHLRTGLYLLHHLLEVGASRDVLAGVPVVDVLVQNPQVLSLGVLPQVIELRVYRLAVLNLHLRGDADVQKAGLGAGGIWCLGIFSCHVYLTPSRNFCL